MANGPPRLAEILGEQLALLGLFVLFVGMGSVEAYYLEFGLRYQNLSLPATHLVYRGLTILLGSWMILLLYAAAIVWLNIDVVMRRWHPTRIGTYIFVLVLLLIGYPLARHAGKLDAARDLDPMRTRLPRLVSLVAHNKEYAAPNTDYRLLISSGGFVVFFAPSSDPKTSSPRLIYVSTGAFDEMRTAM
jgi:hypothetical protein